MLDRAAAHVQSAWMARSTAGRARGLAPVVAAVAAHGPAFESLSDEALLDQGRRAGNGPAA